jgi:hypothetical protein
MKKSLLFLLTVFSLSLAVHAQDTTQQQYLGKYKFPAGSVVPEVTVTIESGVLMMSSTAGTSSLQLVKGDTFTIVSFSGTAIFKRNEGNKVVGVHIDAGGYVLDGTKEESSGILISLMKGEGDVRKNYRGQ